MGVKREPIILVLTSRPYRIENIEDMGSAFSDIRTQPSYTIDAEALDASFSAISGSIRVLLRVYDNYAPEGIDASFAQLDGSIRTTLRSYDDYAPEGLDSSFNAVSGTLNEILITYDNYAPEALDSSFVSIVGTFS